MDSKKNVQNLYELYHQLLAARGSLGASMIHLHADTECLCPVFSTSDVGLER